MSGIKWSGNATLLTLADRIQKQPQQFMEQARALMAEQLVEGEQSMLATIENAVTPTGAARAAAGEGASGRIDTGFMHDEVLHAIIDDSEAHLEGEFGWLHAEDYFQYQEDGTEKIAPMHALNQAFNTVRDNMTNGLKKIAREL